jgi:phosphomannomutase/phosphoglucomutase
LSRGKASTILLLEYLESSRIILAVGRDNRIHGEELQKSFIQGLLETGCNVVNVGPSPSPLLYFTVAHKNFDGGINVTASHNPKEYNGLKVIGKRAHSICGDELQEIRKIIENDDFLEGKGELSEDNFFEDYLTEISKKISLKRNLKIVVDAGNGIAGQFYPQIFEKLGCEVVKLFCESDGSFPNHEPDPIVAENLVELQKKVVEEKADLGIAFDGDGDRVGVIDEKGEIHDANQLLILLARDILARTKTSVIYTVSCSSSIPEEIEKLGGKATMVPVGHSFVEQAMREHQALLGGEQSGHFFIAEDYYSFDDACFTAARILRIASESEDTFSSLFSKMPQVRAIPEIRPDSSDDQKFEIIKALEKDFEEKYQVNTMDGIRIDLDNGAWASIRASNTSPKLSISVEARTQEDLDQINDDVWSTLEEHGIKNPYNP